MTTQLTVGVAVPGYFGHIQYIYDLLDSYEAGTEKPNKLVISLSSMPSNEFVLEKSYSYPIEILCSTDMQLPAKNRNVAKARLDTDIISFMDIDDKAHPNRIEYIRRAFTECPDMDVLLHNFTRFKYFTDAMEPQEYLFFENTIYVNDLLRSNTKLYAPLPPSKHERGIVMHSQPSLKKEVAHKYNYSNWIGHKYKEDLIFLRDLYSKKLKFGYLESRLSHYRPHS